MEFIECYLARSGFSIYLVAQLPAAGALNTQKDVNKPNITMRLLCLQMKNKLEPKMSCCLFETIAKCANLNLPNSQTQKCVVTVSTYNQLFSLNYLSQFLSQ